MGHWGLHRPRCRTKGTFEPGDKVLVQALKSRADLNGCVGEVQMQLETGRWRVTVAATADTVDIKPGNLVFLQRRVSALL